jgi:pyruvate kinase
MKRARRTRIVATLGPATSGEAAIRALFEAGADVFRLDFSHGSPAVHGERIKSIRRIEAATGRPIGVLLDLQGRHGASSALTPKDRDDLALGLELGVDWVALSFVQRPEDIAEAREIIGDRAWIMAKIETPAAIRELAAIVAVADGIMVARGDLGIELPPEEVPELQRLIVRSCRQAGKPVVVATQMLESMIHAPVPTRAEVSDIATAIYDGVDAVMLSAESASGDFPLEAVTMMNRIITQTESSASYRAGIDASHTPAEATTADAVCCSLRRVAALIAPAVTITYTASGFTSLRAARERPVAPILSLTPEVSTARRLALVWGVHAVLVDQIHDVGEMVKWANRTAVIEGFAGAGADVVIVAGLPFGERGTTNLLHVSRIAGAATVRR